MSRAFRSTYLLFVCLFFSCFVNAQVAVTASAGNAGPVIYPTIRSAFDAVNAGTHSGDVLLTITGNTMELVTATLNASGTGAANYTSVLMRPAAGTNPVISGAADPMIRLSGSFITIDGSNNNSNSRDLTFINSHATSSSCLQVLGTGTNLVRSVTIRNSKIINKSDGNCIGIIGDIPGSGCFFEDLSIRNNNFCQAQEGLLVVGEVVAGRASEGLTVEDNNFDAVGVDALGARGMYISNINRASISNNRIGNFNRAHSSSKSGILLTGVITNTTVANNSIVGLIVNNWPSAQEVVGIIAAGSFNNSSLLIAGNEISGISNETAAPAIGIKMTSYISGVHVIGNKISNIRNIHPRGHGAMGIWLIPVAGTNTSHIIQNNFIWDIAGAGFAGNTSNDNGHGIVIDNNCDVDIDHNTVLMNSNVTNIVPHTSSCLMISSRVTNAKSINIRGNIFVNAQTLGTLQSRFSLFIWNRIVVNNMDHNVFYSVSGNYLRYSGGLVSSLAGIGGILGGNANSMIELPVFTGANDLHLQSGSNAAIEGKAAPISGLTQDIDGDVRDITNPDPGADEVIWAPRSQTLQFDVQTTGSTVNVTYGDPVVSGSATASSGLVVGYNSGNTAVATIDANGVVNIIGVGSTVITASQPGDASYSAAADISFTLVVNPKAVTVTADAASKTYGDADPAFTYSLSPALVAGDVLTIDLVRDIGESAGVYTIRQNNMSAGNNYTLTYVANDLTIVKRTLTVTADDQSRHYGEPNPSLTFSYSGFVFGDDASAITTQPAAYTPAVPNSLPDNYPIIISGGAAANYDFSFVQGILTVQPVIIQVIQQAASNIACANEQVVFSFIANTTPANAPMGYQWQFSTDGINFTDIAGEVSTVLRYRATVAGYLRCKIAVPGAAFFFQPARLAVNAQPAISVVKQVGNQDCRNPVVRLSASGAVSYQWSPSNGLDNAGISNPVASPRTTTTYTVTGEDANGCKNTARVEVMVSPAEYNVPNAFTPDHDGKNDCWGVRHWRDVSQITIIVMNRWGNQVFQTADVTNCWDGTVKGMPQPAGSYVYYIKAVTPCGMIERKGSILLIR